MKYKTLLSIPLLTYSINTWAGEVAVIAASFSLQDNGDYQVSVTLRHDDSGWAHYADAWRIVDGKNTVLATRTLHHPHVDEQPFTRSLSNVRIDNNVSYIVIEAHDNVHGWSTKRLLVDLSKVTNGQLTVQTP